MRLGCFSCLFVTVGLMFLAIVAGGFLFLSGNILEDPRFEPLEWNRAEASTARARLAEVGGVKFEPFALRLTPGQFALQGRTVLGNLLQGPLFAQLASQVPAAQL